MKEDLIFLLLDLMIPAVFYFLGRCRKGPSGRALARESLALFFAALIMAPLAYSYTRLEVQGVLCAVLLMLQFWRAYRCSVHCKKKHNILL